MTDEVKAKLGKLPASPGVYFYKDTKDEIIYIGKASNLRNRVRQYFQKSRAFDPKTDVLVSEIANVEWTELETEADALFLEAELIRRYQPRFNILLRDDKSQLFVRIDYKSDYPTVRLIRRPLDDGAEYFGPYINGLAINKALHYLRRAFPYATAKPIGQSAGRRRVSLHYHLGLDPGLEENKTSLTEYKANLRKLMQYLRGGRVTLTRQIEKDMHLAAKAKNFEQAAVLRNRLRALQELSKQPLLAERELAKAAQDHALTQLARLLGLPKPPQRVEGYDISHIQGSDTVASMVVFIGGVPYKTAYRKFKMHTPGNDDFAHIFEALTRRFSETNRKKWGIPNLILIDGGKGQLEAALKVLGKASLDIPTIGIAKKYDDIILKKPTTPQNPHLQGPSLQTWKKMGVRVVEDKKFIVLSLPENSPAIKLLQRVRDESHRFAVSYHHSLRQKRQTASLLEEIPGIGVQTRKKLTRHFGSAKAVLVAEPSELQAILGKKRGLDLASKLKTYRT
jgi:excinuclease ABC subunit C